MHACNREISTKIVFCSILLIENIVDHKFMRAIILSFFFLLVFTGSRSQALQRRLDSLIRVDNNYRRDDSLRAIHLKDIFKAYAALKNRKSAQEYIDSAVAIASKLPRKGALAIVYSKAGSVYHMVDRARAIAYYNKAIETAAAAGLLFIEGGAHLSLGVLYMDVADYPKSLEQHEYAINLFRRCNDTDDEVSCYMNMSSIYNEMGKYVESMQYARKALKAFEREQSPRGVPIAYDQIADIIHVASDEQLRAMGIDPANRLAEQAAALYKGRASALNSGDSAVIVTSFTATAKLYELLGRIKDAQKDYLRAMQAANGDMELDSYGQLYTAAGQFYINKLKNIPAGIGMLHAALDAAVQTKQTEGVLSAAQALSEAHEQLRNYDSALYYFRLQIVAKDSIFSRQKEMDFTRRQLRLDFDIREREYKTAQQLANATMKQQEQEILLRRQQLQISDKEKTLQRLTFLQKQAELENQRKTQGVLLTQQKMKAAYDRRASEQEIGLQRVQLDSNRKVSAFLGLVAIVVCTAALFMYNSRRKTVKLNAIVSHQKAELEEMVQVKDKIFSIVSHDIKGPVNNIIAFSTLLSENGVDPERLPAYMEQIKTTLDHTSSLMENLLNWSASQMQGFNVAAGAVDVTKLAAATVAGIIPSAQKKGVTIKNTVPDDVIVTGDANMIELIIRNLVNNAVKFSRKGTDVVISAARTNDRIVMSVADRGVGIEKDKLARINSASAAAVDSTIGTAKEKGTGLGLMLCKHFASLMNGKLSAESAPGEGSIFHFELPAA